ncbi:MAG: hypothetical protein JOY99_08485 [Sphingomonadaceae bacterium]|nr:hypothetical protein [Sphingomonadaceae bacterium]
MVLFPALLLASSSPTAADVTGMKPQLEVIRRDAAERRWQITCEGRAGEETVLRLNFPKRISGETVRAYFENKRYVGSSTHYFYRETLSPNSCNGEPITTAGSGFVRVLSVGPRATLVGLAELAKACFTNAVIRERKRDDLPEAAAQAKSDWMTLDAGEDVTSRYGPTVCFIKMRANQPASPIHDPTRNGS